MTGQEYHDDTYTLVVSQHSTATLDDLDNPKVTAIHRSPLLRDDEAILISESRIQRAMQRVLDL